MLLGETTEKGGPANATSTGGLDREAFLSPVRGGPKKRKKRSRSPTGKARKARSAGADESAGGKANRLGGVAAVDKENSVEGKAARGGNKAGGKGSVGASKAVQEPIQVPTKPTPPTQAEDLLSTDLSPIPQPQKRPRKLLGGRTSRCKTPKAKKTNHDVASTTSADDTASPPTAITAAAAAAGPSPHRATATADAVVASVPAAAPTAPVATAVGVVPRKGVGPKSGAAGAIRAQLSPVPEATGVVGAGARSAAAAAMATANVVGPSAGGSGSSGAPAAKRALKPLKLSTNSILAMRGKSTMRTSMFKSFLDPKQGFKVPKLKPGASRS